MIEDAITREITCLTAERLSLLLDLHDQYAVAPEQIVELLHDPGAFQDDRMDQLRELIDSRKDAMSSLLDVIKALDHAEGEIQDPAHLRWVLVGLDGPENAPDQEFIKDSLSFLSHPCLGIVEKDEAGYRLISRYENSVKILQTNSQIIGELMEDKAKPMRQV